MYECFHCLRRGAEIEYYIPCAEDYDGHKERS